MREMEFKMERAGQLVVGQEVTVSEGMLPTSYYYTINPSLAMSKNFELRDRLYVTEGVVKSIEERSGGYYVMVEFDEKVLDN